MGCDGCCPLPPSMSAMLKDSAPPSQAKTRTQTTGISPSVAVAVLLTSKQWPHTEGVGFTHTLHTEET